MNKTYRVVYNETTRTYTAVAEIATARGKSAGVVDGTVSAQTTVRKPKGRMIAGWTLGAALLNFSMMFGFTMLPAAEVVAATCTMNAGATTGAATQVTSLACGVSATANGAWSVANGASAQALGGGSTAEGFAAVAGKDSTAIGAMAAAGYNPVRNANTGLVTNLSGQTGNQSVALGYKALAYGDQSLAIGGDTVASGAASIAIGGDDLDGLAGNAGLQDTFSKLSGEALNVGTYKGTTSSGAGSVAVGVQAVSDGAFATASGTRANAAGAASTALGVASTATGSAAFAGAAGSKALGNSSVAVGAQADATALNAIAIGQASQATASNATALGSEALATAVGASALGLSAKAQAENGVALGVRANVATTGIKGVAIGEDATSSNEKSIALGASSKSSGDKSIAIGDSANATNTHSFAIGGQSLSTGTNAMAIGSNAQATGNFSVAQGNAASASAEQSQAMGVEAVASAAQAVAIGPKAQATAVNTFAGGVNSVASGQQAVAIGSSSQAIANNAIALGNSAQASGANAIASGVSAKAAGSSAIASGNAANASGNESIAIGRNALSSGANSVATGYGAQATANQAIATGQNAQAIGISSIALGQNAKSGATGMNNTIAIGTNSNVTAASAVAIGQNAKVESANATALGMGATVGAGFERAVALGSSSTVSAAVPTDSATVGNLTYGGFEGKSPEVGDVVSVGNGTRKRQIQNVAAGRINATSTDAINGSQLYATNVVLGNLATSVKNEFGGDAALNPNTGEITFSNIGNTGKDTIHDAIAAVKENVVAGNNVEVTPVVAADGSTTFTVHAKDTTASHAAASADFLTVTGQPQANKVTNYETALTTRATDALKKAETAVQNIASPDGSVTVTTDPTNPNTTNLQVNHGTGISLDNNGALTVAKTTLDQNATTMRFTTPRGQANNFVNAGDLARHLNNAGFKLAVGTVDDTTGVSSDTASDEEAKRIRTGEVLTMTAGKGMNITQVDHGYEFAVDSAEVGVAGNKATVPTDSDNKMATVGSVAKAINESGFTLKTSANGGELVAGSGDEVINPADTVEMIAGKNLTVQQDAAGKITYATKENVEFTSVKAGPVTINNNGIDAGNKQITNVASGGDVDTNAANIGDVKTAVAAAKEKVIAGTNVASVVEGTEGGRTTFTVNAKGTTASVADGDTYLSVTPSDKGNNVTDYQIGLSQSTKDSLAKADTAMQGFTTAVNGATVDTINQTNTVVNFVDGNATTARNKDGEITFDVKVDDTSIVIENGVLKATAQAPQVTNLNVADNKVAAPDAADENKLVTAKTVADAINSAGFTLKTSADGGELLTGSGDETISAGKTVDMAAGKNLTVKQAADGKITYATKNEVEFDKVTTTNLTVNNGGNVDMGSNQITNVASGGDVNTNAANIGDVKTAVAAAKEKVEAGTNIVSVTSQVDDATGATTYTVNAKGTTASVADGDTYLSVTPSAKDNNVTDYQIGLSQSTKNSLAKADTAVQSFTTAVKGATVDTINQQNTVINFVDGVGTTATIKDNDITFDVNKAKLSTDTTGNVTSDKTGDNFVTGEDVANAINEAAKLTEKTTTVVAGSNTHVQAKEVDNNTEYTVSADKATVSVSSALTKTENATTDATTGAVTTDYALDLSQTTKDDIKKGVDAKDIVDNKGLTFTGDSGSTNVEKLGSTVAVNGDTNIVTSAQGDQISIKLKDDITVNSVTANNTTTNNLKVNPNGNVDMGSNQITNVASGGDVDTNAANIGDVKTAVAAAKEKVIAGTNVASVVEGTEDGRTTFTVNAKGTTASSANEDYVTVKAGTPNGENVTDYAVDLSEKAKESLSKADTAVQSFTTSVNGAQAEELNQANKDVNFVNGTGTTARNAGGNITFDVNKAALTTNDAGNVTNNNAGDTFVTGDDVAKAINEATARTEKTTSVVKGSNTHVQSKVDGNNTEYTVSADKATVSTASALKLTKTDSAPDANEAVTTDYNIDLSDETKAQIAKEESVVQGDNVTVTEDGTNSTGGKQFKVALNKNVDLTDTGSVTTGNTTVNNDGVKVGDTTLTSAPITVNGNTVNNVNEAINKTAEQAFNPLTFAGDGGTEFKRKLGEKVNVKGGADEAELSDGNIGVVANGADTLEVKLSKELKDLTSAEFKDPAGNTTVVNGAGTTITPASGSPVSLTTTGLNNGGNQITNVASGGDVDTNAANIADVKKAKTEVAAGTNIVDVAKTTGGNGQDIYTVNAKGTTASVAQGDKYLTVSESPKDGNVTDYQFGLTQSAKDSLFKADTALQSFTTSVNGTPVETINQENSDVGFVNGNVTTAAQSGRDITFDVNFDDKTLKQDGNKLAVNTTTLTPSETDGTVTAGNPDNLATAGDIANAINKAGFKLTASKSEGEVSGETEELVNAGETVTVDAGKNIKLTQAAGKITVATKDDVTFNNVTVNGDVTAGDTVLNSDGLTINNGNTDNKPVTLTKDGLDNGGNTITNVARGEADTDAVNVSQLKEVSNVANAGWNLTAQGENSSNVAANDTVDLNNTDGNIVVSKTADQDDVTFNLAKDIKVDSVTIENGNAGKPVTLSKDGLDNGGNKVTNVADGDINADSKDAVNGSQLFNNAQSIANNLGGGSTVNNDGTVSAPSYTVTNPADGSNRQVNNVGDAVDALNNAVNSPLTFAGDSGDNVERKLGTTLNVKGGATGNLTDNNIAVVADGTDTLNIKLAEKVDLGTNGEVKAGDTTVNNDGVKVGDNVALNSDGLKAGDVSVTTEGINAGDKVISNVAEGKAPTDAVNVSQLEKAAAASKEVVESKDKSVTVTSSKNPDTEATTFDLSVNVDGTTITKGDNGELKATTTTLTPSETDGTVTAGNPDNLATAGDIANAINKAGFKLTATASEGEVAGTSEELVNAGETVTVDAGKNIKLTQAAGKITVATKDDVEFNNVTVNGDVKAGDTVLNKDGVKNGDTSLTKDGITVNNGTAGEPVTLTKDGLNNGGNKVTNVADGDINADSKDAVNGSQLHDIIEKGFKIAADQGSDDTVKLGETVAYRSESGNIVTKVSDNNIDFDLANKITVGNNTANPVTIDGNEGTVTGLSNKTWDPANIVSGQAATEDQLKQVSDVANAGWNLTANGENRSNVAANDTVDLNNTDGNIDISKKADEDKVTFNLAKDITVDSVTAGDTTVNNDGITINNGNTDNKPVSLTKDGLDNGGNKVTNVADGTENSDAVNLSQLKAAKEVVKSEDKSVTVNTTQNNDGANVFDLSVNVDGTTITKGDNGELKANTTTLTPSETDGTVTAGNPDNLATAGDIANAINKAGFKLTATASEGEVAGTSPELVNAGETVTIDAGKNIKLTQAAGKITVATKDDVEFNNVTVNGDVKAGETTLNKDGVKVGDTTLTKAPITVNGTTVNNVNDAINQTAAQAFSPLTFAGDSGNNVERKLGSTLNVKGGATGKLTENNIAVVANGTDTLDIKLAEKVDLGTNGEVKAGDTTVNNDGVKVGDKVSLTQNGLDNGGNQIKNVAAGTEETDGVNVSQLDKAAKAAKTEVVSYDESIKVTEEVGADGQTIYDLAVSVDDTTIETDGNGKLRVMTTELKPETKAGSNEPTGKVAVPTGADAEKLVNAEDIANAINNAGFNVKSGGNKADGDEADAELVKAGEEVELNAGKNLKVKRTGKVFTFETADDVAFNNVTVAGDLTAGDTVLNKDGITINNGAADKPVKLGKDGLDNGGNKITNVAAGDADTDGVNVSQLKDAQAAATTKVIEGDNIKVTSETNDDGSTTYKVETAKNVKFDSVTTGDTVMNNDGVKVGDTTLTKAPITVNGNTVNNVNDAINQTAAQAFSPLTFAGDSGNNVERKLGTTLNVKGGATGKLTDNNIAVVANGTDTLDIKLAEKVDLGKDGEVKAGDTTVNNDGVKVGDNVALTSDGLKAGDVSVTTNGLDNGGNQIKNVAAGTEDTDGVNVSQLKAAQAAATTKVVEGDNMVVTSETNDDGSTTYKVETAKNVKFDSVTTGDTVMNNDGVKVGDNVALNSDGLKAGDVSVSTNGLDNGGNQIKNVAAGTEDTDGVNVSQLKAAQNAATTKVKGDKGVTVTPSTNGDGSTTYTVAAKTDGTTVKVDDAGNITANTTKLENNAKGAVNAPAQPNTLATAGDIANAINNAGFTAKANGDAGELINAGEEVNFNNGDNIKVTRSGSDFTIATAKDVKFDSVQLGDNGPKITNNGGNVNVAGNNGAPTKITGVKAGEAPTDAVNVSQLNAAQAAATTKVVQGKNMVVTPSKNTDGSTTYEVATANDLNVNSVTAGNTTVNGNGVTIAAPVEGNPQNTVSLSPVGLNNGGNTITNVAPGVNDTDAANVGQLKAVGNQLGNRINQVDADGKAGVAQAMATAGLPQAYLPGKSMMAVGGGVYRGETGYAVGFSSISDGGNWIIKGTASGNSRGHYGATAAVGYQW